MNNKKLKRLLELSNIKGTSMKESSVRPNRTVDLIKKAANGKTYAIVRENRTYYIKVTDTKSRLIESDFNFIGGVQNKTKNSFSGFDDAVSRLNLMFNDINRSYNVQENIDMKTFDYVLNEDCGEFVDSDMDESTELDEECLEEDCDDVESLQEKRFVLKQPKPKVKAPEPEMDFSEPEAGGEDFGGDTGGDEFDFGDSEGGEDFGAEGGDDFDFGDSEGGDDFDFESGGEDEGDGLDFGDEEVDSTEGGDPIKDIQKTTGTLGQQLRDTEDLSSDMQKWVAKSVISALDLNTMDDADKDDVIKALESGGDEGGEQEVDFMEDDFMSNDYRGGEPDLDSGEEILLDDEDEGPGGYLGFEEMPDETSYMASRRPQKPLVRREKNPIDGDRRVPRQPWQPRQKPLVRREENPEYKGTSYMDDEYDEKSPRAKRDAEKDIRSHYNKPSFDELERGHSLPHDTRFSDEDVDVNGPMSYMTDEDMLPCENEECLGKRRSSRNRDNFEEGMSSWMDDEANGGMGWEHGGGGVSEDVSYMDDEELTKKFDSQEYSDDIYGMNNPQEAPAEPTTKPDVAPTRPTRPSTTPFEPPERIKPGEETRPKARKRKSRYDVDYMGAEPAPSTEPTPTIAPTKPGTDRPTRPSTTPFNPPERIRPGEETRPKAWKRRSNYDDDVTFE